MTTRKPIYHPQCCDCTHELQGFDALYNQLVYHEETLGPGCEPHEEVYNVPDYISDLFNGRCCYEGGHYRLVKDTWQLKLMLDGVGFPEQTTDLVFINNRLGAFGYHAYWDVNAQTMMIVEVLSPKPD